MHSLLVASLINQSWKNNGFFIQFVPYGEVTDFQYHDNSNPGKTQFAKPNCTDHWVNDPRRPNYISCDLTYGGEEGMTVLTQPYSNYKGDKNGGTLSQIKDAAFKEDQIHYEFKVDNVLQSSLDGTALYGFNYNFTTAHLQDLVHNGAAKISNDFATVPPNTAGLYNLDVCRITEMSFVGGAQQYGKSIHSGASLTNFIEIYVDPCICSTFKDRNGTLFTNAATINVTQAITTYPETGENCTTRAWPANAADT
ncbi:hypothetical protein OEA41_010056 [Lepraria neglecta]|uniref:Uncharacterized protein n=1 Tax=Lepraria neglecta TaxID=209136 RepID=A0AAE0DES2_9LECA|nr:hypothetical protein OEA41_010056 [Lepraria neglecta]